MLIGLTIEETSEFQTLDNLPALDEPGGHVARDENGAPTATREKRWRELYCKHDIAWMEWKTRAQADRREASGFVNIIERPYAWFPVIFSMNPEYENVSAGSSA